MKSPIDLLMLGFWYRNNKTYPTFTKKSEQNCFGFFYENTSFQLTKNTIFVESINYLKNLCMALVYLGIGTNIGDKEANLNQAMIYLREEVGEIYNVSSFFTSKPWGFESENNFSNAALLINTELSPLKLLAEVKKIEKKMGRIYSQTHNYEDRIIDIDILIYENLIINQPNLVVPQNLMAQREFVLVPLAEIAPDLVHPQTKKTILQMRDELKVN